MPTYEYRCESCGTRFEVWQKMSDDPLTTCQTCGGPVHRVLYPAGIVFKGGGFYSTDNRAKSAAAASGQTPAAAGETASTGGAKESGGTGSGGTAGESAPAAVESKSTTPKS